MGRRRRKLSGGNERKILVRSVNRKKDKIQCENEGFRVWRYGGFFGDSFHLHLWRIKAMDGKQFKAEEVDAYLEELHKAAEPVRYSAWTLRRMEQGTLTCSLTMTLVEI